MSKYQLPNEISELASALASFPGIGPKLASRLAVYMSVKDSSSSQRLADSISSAIDHLSVCEMTGNVCRVDEYCSLYTDEARERNSIMVVESPLDLIQIEDTDIYNGLYLVLGGLISPINGVGPDQLNIKKLENLLRIEEEVDEVILALSATVEGEATSLYIGELIGRVSPKVKISRLAKGIPTGSSVEFIDSNTLRQAFERRI